jgi:hypothetical protein
LGGGDFNLVRNQREKSNGVINFHTSELFNEWIDRWRLMEIKDPSRSFTWSNNQMNHVMATLDRVLVSVHWANRYPMAKVTTLPKGVSNHNPLLMNFGDKARCKNHLFRFEKLWLEMDSFDNLVKQCWSVDYHLVNPIDRWQFKMRNLRKNIKGWSWNVDAEMRRINETILFELDGLDKAAELQQLNAQELDRRKSLRNKMDKFWRIEEIKARQRSRERERSKRETKTLPICLRKLVNEGGRKIFLCWKKMGFASCKTYWHAQAYHNFPGSCLVKSKERV